MVARSHAYIVRLSVPPDLPLQSRLRRMPKKQHRSPITMPGYRKGYDPPNKGRKLPAEILTPDELHRLMATFDLRTKRGARNAAMAALMARAGMKVGQVLAMERWHFEPGSHIVTVPAGSGKTSTERKIAIDSVTRELLDGWMAIRRDLNLSRMAPLFATVNEPTKGNPVHDAYVRAMLHEAADKAGIEKRVTPSGLKKTYEQRTAERSSRIVSHLAAHIDEATFASRYPVAYEKWRSAFDLYEVGPVQQATRIGHDCREAILEFANDLIAFHDVDVDPAAGTQIKVRAAFDAQPSMSPSVRAYVDRLVAFWRAVSDLAQRQEHAASRETRALAAEDARRLVFQTLTVMAEIDSALRRPDVTA
jgi:hypothetical protein